MGRIGPIEPDLLVDLHSTVAQCRMYAGRFEESIATLNRALASPGISPRDRAWLLVLAARTRNNFGAPEEARRVATEALAAASEAGDNWAMGWALHVLALVTGSRGHMTGRRPRSIVAACWTMTPPGCSRAAKRYQDAGRPPLRTRVLEAAAVEFARADAHDRARAASAGAAEIYTQLGAAVDDARVRARL